MSEEDGSRDGVTDALANVVLFVVAALVSHIGYFALTLLALARVHHRALTPLLRRWRPSDGIAVGVR
ncbi:MULTISPECIES: hypothetical protein [Bacteria]|uniref:hypothetical protein n=1 Tax=Bacteria TaxID=2 RepID=UPI0018CD93A7